MRFKGVVPAPAVVVLGEAGELGEGELVVERGACVVVP